MGEIQLLTDEWPLVIARWPADGDEAGINAYFDLYPALLERARREGPIVFITDLRQISVTATNAKKRRAVANRVEEFSTRLAEVIRREACVVNSIWSKASLTAVQLFVPPKWETKVFQDEADARAWLAEAPPEDR
jgi:hypothetical protein